MTTTNTPGSQVEITTSPEKLNQKGFKSTKVALATLALVTSIQLAHAEPTSSSSFVANPAYDQIIAEAQKSGKDPIKTAMEMKEGGRFTFSEFRNFSKYYTNQVAIARKGEESQLDQAAIADEAKIAALKEEKTSLLQQSTKNQAELDILIPAVNKQYRQYVVLFSANGSIIGPDEIAKINYMYNDKITYPDIKKDIGEKLGKYLKSGSIKLAQR